MALKIGNRELTIGGFLKKKQGYPSNHPLLTVYTNKPTMFGGPYFKKPPIDQG